MCYKMIYWTPISGSYFLKGSILEKCGILLKNSGFSRRIWLDWGNTARADMAGLGSIGLTMMITMMFQQTFCHFSPGLYQCIVLYDYLPSQVSLCQRSIIV